VNRSASTNRPLVWLAGLAVVAGACTGDDGATTTTAPPTLASTTTSSSTTTSGAPQATSVFPDPRLLEEIPTDPDVAIGELDNGLTYYVRENLRPGGRAQLRLVVDAGSAVEDDDQSGAAHFLEHMLFNGTERFPANELTRVLESFGARFGPDVNAYTSFDETVYELAIPTDDPALLELGFDVLLEWAARATIAQEEVAAERGVVLEEWRLRDAGVDGRISELYEDVFLAGTGYEGRAPIGDPAVLGETGAETLRRFYDDWYRPSLMAVVAVGDFDGDLVLAMIEERFADLESAQKPRSRPSIAVPENRKAGIGVLADADQPTASVEIYYPGPTAAESTVGDRLQGWARLFATDMIATRLNDDVTRGAAPFFSVDALDFDFTRGVALPGFAADTPASDAAETVRALVVEVERALRHRYSVAEFERARQGWEAAVEQAYAGRASTQDFEFAERYVRHFLAGGSLPSAQQEFDLDKVLLALLTVEDVSDALVTLAGGMTPTAVVIGPADGTIPDENGVAAAIELARTANIEPRPDDADIGETLLAAPDPVGPMDENLLPLGITELVYPNGVRVHYTQTDISVNQVVMGATSPGGLSRVVDEDVAEAFLIGDIVARSGAGVFDRVALDTFLSGRVVSLFPYIDVTREGMYGNAATEDLEVLLQLVHLTMVAPRADDSAARAVIGEFRPYAESPENIPGLATTLELIEQRWGGEPRYDVVLDTAELDGLDLEAARRVFAERFGNAGDFVFSFAGDFSSSQFRALADRYLGTLPATDRDDGWIDHQIDPPARVIDETVAVGDSEQGFVTFLFTAELNRDTRLDVQVSLLNLIADAKLRDRIREALSATYSPFLSVAATDEPDPLVETYLQVSGDPDRLDEIVAESLATLQTLATDGPSAKELATAQEQLSRQYELVSNEWWVDQMLFYASRPDESLESLLDRFDYIDATTAADIRELASIAFPTDEYVLVRQVPR